MLAAECKTPSWRFSHDGCRPGFVGEQRTLAKKVTVTQVSEKHFVFAGLTNNFQPAFPHDIHDVCRRTLADHDLAGRKLAWLQLIKQRDDIPGSELFQKRLRSEEITNSSLVNKLIEVLPKILRAVQEIEKVHSVNAE